MFHPYHPVKAGLAIFCMLLFLACLALFAWSAHRGALVNGPVHIAADAAGVYLSFNEEILALDRDGGLVTRHTLDALGLSGRPIDLRAGSDGTLLIATQRPAGLRLCDTRDWQCRSVDSPLFAELRSQIKVLPDPENAGYLISDTGRGRVHWLSADGATWQTLTPERPFKRVNDIALDDQQRLWVADSGNHRLVIMERDADGEWAMTAELSAETELARPGLDWPMMITFSAAGNAWVAQPDGRGAQADLLIYDRQQGARARVALPEGRYPTDVTRLGERMLITDMDSFTLEQIAIDSQHVTPFGDEAVQQQLAAGVAEQVALDRRGELGMAGMLVFGVLMIGLAVWASPRGKRFTPAPKVAALEPREPQAASSGELHWLVRHAKTERFLRMAKALLLVTTLALAGTLVYAGYSLNKLLDGKELELASRCVIGISELLLVLGALVLGAQWLAYLGFRSMRNRLGSDGNHLHVQTHQGLHLTLDPVRLVYSSRVLAFEDRLFPIQTGHRQPLYNEGEIETHIAPLLNRATRLSVLGMFRHQLRYREPATMAAIFYVIAAAAVVAYTGLWRLMLPGN